MKRKSVLRKRLRRVRLVSWLFLRQASTRQGSRLVLAGFAARGGVACLLCNQCQIVAVRLGGDTHTIVIKDGCSCTPDRLVAGCVESPCTPHAERPMLLPLLLAALLWTPDATRRVLVMACYASVCRVLLPRRAATNKKICSKKRRGACYVGRCCSAWARSHKKNILQKAPGELSPVARKVVLSGQGRTHSKPRPSIYILVGFLVFRSAVSKAH